MTALLEQAANMPLEDYQPGLVIQAVNALQSLGKDKALSTLNDFANAHRSSYTIPYGLFWVTRVLFDMPEGVEFPPLHLGQPTPPLPGSAAAARALPRFPIVMVGDVPLLVVRGYSLGGIPERITTHLEYYRKYGVLRKALLVPPASTCGLETGVLAYWPAAYGAQYVAEMRAIIQPQINSLK